MCGVIPLPDKYKYFFSRSAVQKTSQTLEIISCFADIFIIFKTEVNVKLIRSIMTQVLAFRGNPRLYSKEIFLLWFALNILNISKGLYDNCKLMPFN